MWLHSKHYEPNREPYEKHDDDIDDGSFLCSVCPYQTISREQLLKHIAASHAKHTCNTCNITCNSKTELNTHIVNSHKSHKPCRNYATGSCEHENEDCKFKHVILQRGQYICYKWRKIFKTQTDLMDHIKTAHGKEACIKFQNGERQHGNRCIFTLQNCLLEMWQDPKNKLKRRKQKL